MLFILHIKGTASDVQDIMKYLPVMPGRQYLLIQPLLPRSLLKKILYEVCHPHHVHYFTPYNLFVVPLLQDCENDNDM